MTPPAILGDWGTSNLRLWRMRDGRVIDRRTGPGIGALDRPAQDVLSDLVRGWLDDDPAQPMVLCGMAGARNGLHEAGYVACPATVTTWAGGVARTTLAGRAILIAGGLSCHLPEGAGDVMRGEETQIFGACAIEPALNMGRTTLVLPGTHAKWVTLDHGTVTEFRTFMTGELFALLTRSSLLAAGMTRTGDGDHAGFAQGIAAGRSAPGLIGALFHVRTAQLLDGRSADWAHSYLSGLLLAAEISEMQARGALPATVLLIGAADLCERYAQALAAFDVSSRRLDDEACTLAGLELIHAYA